MTPLGLSTWRLIRDDHLTLAQRLSAASSLWADGNILAAAYAAEFAGRCFVLAERTQRTLGRPGSLDVGHPSSELQSLLGDAVWDAGQRTWDMIAAMHAASQMGVPDPAGNTELQALAQEYREVACFMFAYFGRGALDFVRGADPDLTEAFDWLQSDLEEIDAHLSGYAH